MSIGYAISGIGPALARALATVVVCLLASAPAPPVGAGAPGAALVRSGSLPPWQLTRLGQPRLTAAAIVRARANGLPYTDRPSLGSGLEWAGGDEYWGLTDRGPNTIRVTPAGAADGLLFALPEFTPVLVRFRLSAGRMEPLWCVPLRSASGRPLSGLPNVAEDGPAYGSRGAEAPPLLDPDGLDPEALRRFPDGRFLLGDEYGPSLVVVEPDGRVAVRYVPEGKALPAGAAAVRAILPSRFARRRANRGFESVALSADGRTAYATLESPMGDASDRRYAASRVLRTVRLDLTDPLRARVTGEFLLVAGAVAEYTGTAAQNDVRVTDADWVAPGRVLMIERGKGIVRLVLVDYGRATNILHRPAAAGLEIEAEGPEAHRIRPASRRVVFDSRAVPDIDQDKLEGLAILAADRIALASDNDFGIGDNTTGAPSKLWEVRLRERLPLTPRTQESAGAPSHLPVDWRLGQ